MKTNPFLLLLGLAGAGLLGAAPSPETPVQIKVTTEVANPVSNLLFGQMLERFGPAHSPEKGGQGMMNAEGKVRPDVYRLIKSMEIPIVRFPGGYFAENPYSYWWDMVDRAGVKRNPNYSLGYGEFFEMAEELHWQSIIVLNLQMAARRANKDTLHEDLLKACGIVAYLCAPVGAELPAGMPDWPAVRAANGHPEPYSVNYFQIGNEINAYFDAFVKTTGLTDPAEQAAWLQQCIEGMIQITKSIAPQVPIIVDGVYWNERYYAAHSRVYADGAIRKQVGLMANHIYRPWGINQTRKNGVNVDLQTIKEDQLWNALVAVPATDEQGQSIFRTAQVSDDRTKTTNDERTRDTIKKHGFKIAMTEWNWNGWGSEVELTKSYYMRGIGAAGFLHAIMRAGGDIQLATQSLLIGNVWDLASIHIPDTGDAYLQPTGIVTTFYNKHHGGSRLRTLFSELPIVEQPLQIEQILPSAQLSLIDCVVTEDKDTLYLHIINRDFSNPRNVQFDLSSFASEGIARIHQLTGYIEHNPDPNAKGKDRVIERSFPADIEQKKLTIELPKQSISIIEISKVKAQQ